MSNVIKKQYSKDYQIKDKLEEKENIRRLKQFVQKEEEEEAQLIQYMEKEIDECKKVCSPAEQEMLLILEEKENGINELRNRRIEFESLFVDYINGHLSDVERRMYNEQE